MVISKHIFENCSNVDKITKMSFKLIVIQNKQQIKEATNKKLVKFTTYLSDLVKMIQFTSWSKSPCHITADFFLDKAIMTLGQLNWNQLFKLFKLKFA